MPPIFVGLTGGIGAGKSEALAAFARAGAATLASDRVVHDLLHTGEMRDRLVKRWGGDVAPRGEIDRGRVGKIVFRNPEELAWLEAQLHPPVGKRIAEWRAALPGDTKLAVVEVPLLFETGMEKSFDAVVCVVAEDSLREQRLGALGLGGLEGRTGRQLGQDEKAARATHVISNDGTLADLRARIADLAVELIGDGTAGDGA